MGRIHRSLWMAFGLGFGGLYAFAAVYYVLGQRVEIAVVSALVLLALLVAVGWRPQLHYIRTGESFSPRVAAMLNPAVAFWLVAPAAIGGIWAALRVGLAALLSPLVALLAALGVHIAPEEVLGVSGVLSLPIAVFIWWLLWRKFRAAQRTDAA